MDNQLEQQIFEACPSVFDEGRGACRWIECGNGWAEHIGFASRQLEGINRQVPSGQGVYANQIKEKFGGLRYYIGVGEDFPQEHMETVQKIVATAENACRVTCEICGEPGENKAISGWMSCLCEQCRTKEKEVRRH